MSRVSCPLPGLDENTCKTVLGLAERYGVEPGRLISDIAAGLVAGNPWLMFAEGPNYQALLSFIAAAPGLVKAFEYLLFRGFQRLLEHMVLESVECSPARGGAGCSETTGFELVFGAASEEAPTMLTLSIGYPVDDRSVILIETSASVTADTGDITLEEADEEATRIARKAAARTISYAKRTRRYQELEDYLAYAGESWWSLSLEPGDGVEDGVPEVTLELEAAAAPGLILPFDLNPLLDLTAYLAARLQKEYNRLKKQNKAK